MSLHDKVRFSKICISYLRFHVRGQGGQTESQTEGLIEIYISTRRPVPISELFFNVKNAMFILKRYVYFVLYTKLEKEQCFRFI